MSAVRIRDLVRDYGERRALAGVSMEVGEGAVFGLLGPNGSGKTTLFRVLSTLMEPTSGEVSVFGHDVVREAVRVRRAIGVVFQSPSLDGKLTAEENLRHQGRLYGLGGADLRERIRESLERLGVADRAGERTEKLSGGLQRRVELAKGLLHRPRLLLLDEPSSALDPGARRDLWTYLHGLRDEAAVTCFLTTHLMEEAERCDRLAILDGGKLVALGTPDELKAEIGGDVLTLEGEDPEGLAGAVGERFGLEASVVDGRVRLELRDGHAFIPRLVEAFPERIRGVSLGKPTLEDVFIRRTGHRFWGGEE